jgi:alpha-tubulin suppressor-like RCC1 family protein
VISVSSLSLSDQISSILSLSHTHTLSLHSTEGALCGVDFFHQQLDLSRISAHNITESHPFNIFSWLVVGSSPQLKDELKFTPGMISDFETCSLTTSPTYSEECSRNLLYLQQLLSAIGLSEEMWNGILKILAAILHLQRLVVSGSDAATISAATKNHVGFAESILGLEQASLGPTLLKRAVDMHGTKTLKNLSQEDATIAIFTLSSELYLRVMNSLLKHCSLHTPIQTDIGGPILQLIDTSGAEIFQVNNLSQLILHMTEEKMNEHLIYRSFQREVEFLRSEGVEAPPVGNIMDFEPILLLIEKPPISLFNLLEEACLLPRGNDNALLDKILSTHSKGKLVRTGGRQAKASCFLIKHNFGDVLYDIDGFTNANKSRISGDAKTLLVNTLCEKFTFLKTEDDLQKDEDLIPSSGGGGASAAGRRKIEKPLNKNLFLANRARDQLQLLLDSIQGSEIEGTADPLMIFCIRGSADIKSLTFDPSYASPQLDFLNLSPLASFAKKGYAQRSLYKEFYERYRVMFPYVFKELPWKYPSSSTTPSRSGGGGGTSGLTGNNHEGKVLCKHLLEEIATVGCLPHLFHDETIAPNFGHNFLFTHSRLLTLLENLRQQILQQYSQATLLIQALVRMKKQWKFYQYLLKSTLFIQTSYRKFSQQKNFIKQKKSILLIQKFYKMKLLNRFYQKMKKAIICIENNFYKKKYFFRYQKIKRGLFSLHAMVRGYVLRQQINHIIRAVLKLQLYIKDFLKRNSLFYYRRIAVLLIQKVFRGSYCRYLNKPIVKALKIRKNQRIGTAAILKLQSKYRMLRIYKRYHEIRDASMIIRSWTLVRKQRKQYIQILFLIQWLQNQTRRIIAINKLNNLKVHKMLQEEYQHMNRIRQNEMSQLNYSIMSQGSRQGSRIEQEEEREGGGGGGGGDMDMINYRIGGGYYKNAHEKFNRYVIGLDLNFDLSVAYPHGWIPTLLKFNQQLKQNGQKRLSMISIGKNHTVLVDSSSGVYTFGLGDIGQLGHGSKTNESYPRPLETLSYQANHTEGGGISKSISSKIEIISVCTGSDHTLILTVTKRIYSWGSNRRGQLGHSEFNNSSLPRNIVGPKNVRIISCGAYHSACLADPGILHTWGARECLGRRTDSDCCQPQTIPFFQKKRVQLLVCGDIHVTVRAGSNFYSWGLNTHGQLGIGGDQIKNDSDSIMSHGKGECKSIQESKGDVSDDEKFSEESEEDISSRRSAIPQKESAYFVKSGKNSIIPALVELPISASWTEGDFLECQLIAGGRHMLLTLRTRVWCWGWNKFGQIGNGKMTNVLSPIEINLSGPKLMKTSNEQFTPKLSVTSCRIVSAIAGWKHSAVLTKGGVIYIWGYPQLHSACTFQLPSSTLNETLPFSTNAPLLVPHLLNLPKKLSTFPTTAALSSPILGLLCCSSSSFTMTALEILEIDTPTPQTFRREKYQSTRKVDTLEFHNSAVIQREIKQRVREELGPWSKSAYNKTSKPVTESCDGSVASSTSSMYNRTGWGNKTTSQTMNSRTQTMNLGASSHLTSTMIPSSPVQLPSDDRSTSRSGEGEVTRDGLLKLFSPLKREYTKSDSYNQSHDGVEMNMNDYFNIPDRDDERGSTKKLQEDNLFDQQRSRSGRSNKDGALYSNMSLSSLQRKRRSSVTILNPDDDLDNSTIVSKQSQRRSSLQRVNEKNRPSKESNPMASNFTTNDSVRSQNRPTSKLDNEVNSLIQSAKIRKESPTRTRNSQGENISTTSSKRKKEPIKGSAPNYSEELDTQGGLSHIAVSDLATMIQSIKKESLQQMSMSWRA